MDEVVARFQKAVNRVDECLHAISSEDEWHRPTPCSEWDVRELVQHIVNELAWIPPLIEGRTIADVGDELDGDLLGADPLGAFHHRCNLAHAALEEPGALSRTVTLSYGEESAEGYANQVAGDVLIHSWDLARGIGADDALPEDLVAWAMTWAEQATSSMQGSGMVAAPLPVPDDADPQTRLLALFGRAR